LLGHLSGDVLFFDRLGESGDLSGDLIRRLAVVGFFSIEIHHLIFTLFLIHIIFTVFGGGSINRVALLLDRVLVFVDFGLGKVVLQSLDNSRRDLLVFVTVGALVLILVLLITVHHVVFLLIAFVFEVATQVDFSSLSDNLERVSLSHIHVAVNGLGVVHTSAHDSQENLVLALHLD